VILPQHIIDGPLIRLARDETVDERDDLDARPRTRLHAGVFHRSMRLLDRVAGCYGPLRLVLNHMPSTLFEVTGPGAFASRIGNCPLRYVLDDDLTRASAELAFADGARLVGCLDLLRVPAPQLWVEWNDEVHKRVIYDTNASASYDSAASGRRVGVFLQGSADGLRATARTFWADAAAEESGDVTMSPLETHIDLRGQHPYPADVAGVLAGGYAALMDPEDSAMSSLLDQMRFRFDDRWAAYYRAAATDPAAQRHVVHESVAAVARDIPMLLGFFLLLSAKDATRSIPVTRTAINRKRLARGRTPLLDHIEVRASLDAMRESGSSGTELGGRQSPRLHHVRGHLVRRDNSVFWRTPHLRGSASRGMVRSRTVCLSFARPRKESFLTSSART
jgi:hypothetical protein